MKRITPILSFVLFMTVYSICHASLNWQVVSDIPVSETDCLYTHNDTLYASQGAQIYRFDGPEHKWDTLTSPDPTISFVFAINKTGSRLFAGSYNKGVFESDNDGLTWSPRNAGLSGIGSNSIVALATRGDSLYVGTNGASVFVMNLGTPSNWISFNNGIPDNTSSGIISLCNFDNFLLAGAGLNTSLFRNEPGSNSWNEIAFAPFDPRGVGMFDMTGLGEILYGAAGNGLYISHDSGVTWERSPITNRLIGSGAVSADVDRVYGSIWSPTIGTLYCSSTGNGWQLIDSVPFVLGYDLAVLNHRLYSARNDGLWVADLNPTAVGDDQPTLPDQFQLAQNYPNPFNPTTTIEFEIPKPSAVSLEIFNVLGQKVRTLLGRTQSAGKHTVVWDSKDNSGRTVSSGVYVYRLLTDSFSSNRKMLLIK